MPFSQLCCLKKGNGTSSFNFLCHFQSLKFDIVSLMKEDGRIIRRKASEDEPFMRPTDVSSKKFLCVCTIMMVMISDDDDSDDL